MLFVWGFEDIRGSGAGRGGVEYHVFYYWGQVIFSSIQARVCVMGEGVFNNRQLTRLFSYLPLPPPLSLLRSLFIVFLFPMVKGIKLMLS